MAEARLPYGPFTAPIRRFLQHLAALSAVTEADVVEQYRTQFAARPYRAAERALAAAIAGSGRETERDALAGPLLQIVSQPSPPPAPTGAGDSNPAVPKGSPWRDIAEPALGAVLGLMMQDVLSAEEVDALYAPFDKAIARRLLQ